VYSDEDEKILEKKGPSLSELFPSLIPANKIEPYHSVAKLRGDDLLIMNRLY